MTKYRKQFLSLLLIFYIFTLSACQETENLAAIEGVETTLSNEKVESLICKDEMKGCYYGNYDELMCMEFASIGGSTVRIINCEDASLDNFTNNPMFTTHKNEILQEIVINSILYTFGFEVDFTNILSGIDEDVSKHWFAIVFEPWISQFPENLAGMTILKKLNLIRDDNIDSSIILDSIQANFMMRSELNSSYIFEGDYLFISVPIWRSIDGLTLGYLLYDFVFKKINGEYRLIGLSLDT